MIIIKIIITNKKIWKQDQMNFKKNIILKTFIFSFIKFTNEISLKLQNLIVHIKIIDYFVHDTLGISLYSDS